MITTIVILCIAAFAAGFVDAIVGGGGLIQLPVAFVMLPQYPVYTVIGSLKIPAFTGTFLQQSSTSGGFLSIGNWCLGVQVPLFLRPGADLIRSAL